MNTLMKRSGFLPSTPFFDDFLSRDLFNWSGWNNNSGTVPQVNILETNDDFQVEMAAPGMKKNDFHVELDNDMLTIWSELEDQNSTGDQVYTRREFNYHAFKRSFYLPNTVEVDNIRATYKNGLLNLVIPKKEEAKKKPVKTIDIT